MSAPSEVSVSWGWRSKWSPKKASLRAIGEDLGTDETTASALDDDASLPQPNANRARAAIGTIRALRFRTFMGTPPGGTRRAELGPEMHRVEAPASAGLKFSPEACRSFGS